MEHISPEHPKTTQEHPATASSRIEKYVSFAKTAVNARLQNEDSFCCPVCGGTARIQFSLDVIKSSCEACHTTRTQSF